MGADCGANMHGVGGNSWMAGLSGGLGSEVDALATSSAWKLSENPFGGGGGKMGASLGLHDGDIGGMISVCIRWCMISVCKRWVVCAGGLRCLAVCVNGC